MTCNGASKGKVRHLFKKEGGDKDGRHTGRISQIRKYIKDNEIKGFHCQRKILKIMERESQNKYYSVRSEIVINAVVFIKHIWTFNVHVCIKYIVCMYVFPNSV